MHNLDCQRWSACRLTFTHSSTVFFSRGDRGWRCGIDVCSCLQVGIRFRRGAWCYGSISRFIFSKSCVVLLLWWRERAAAVSITFWGDDSDQIGKLSILIYNETGEEVRQHGEAVACECTFLEYIKIQQNGVHWYVCAQEGESWTSKHGLVDTRIRFSLLLWN